MLKKIFWLKTGSLHFHKVVPKTECVIIAAALCTYWYQFKYHISTLLSHLRSGIQNLQRKFSEKVPVDQTAAVPHLLHQKIHKE